MLLHSSFFKIKSGVWYLKPMLNKKGKTIILQNVALELLFFVLQQVQWSVDIYLGDDQNITCYLYQMLHDNLTSLKVDTSPIFCFAQRHFFWSIIDVSVINERWWININKIFCITRHQYKVINDLWPHIW